MEDVFSAMSCFMYWYSFIETVKITFSLLVSVFGKHHQRNEQSYGTLQMNGQPKIKLKLKNDPVWNHFVEELHIQVIVPS